MPVGGYDEMGGGRTVFQHEGMGGGGMVGGGGMYAPSMPRSEPPSVLDSLSTNIGACGRAFLSAHRWTRGGGL